jgi:GNAT superfamily N-acetyltransferase
MGLELYKDYILERFDYQFIEKPDGFGIYEIKSFPEGKCLYLHDLYVTPKGRGLSGTPRAIFNEIKEIALNAKCQGITITVNLDTKNCNEILKLYLFIGFKVINVGGRVIDLYMNLIKEEK